MLCYALKYKISLQMSRFNPIYFMQKTLGGQCVGSKLTLRHYGNTG